MCDMELFSFSTFNHNMSSYWTLITCLWISVVFMISLQHEISCTKETMVKIFGDMYNKSRGTSKDVRTTYVSC